MTLGFVAAAAALFGTLSWAGVAAADVPARDASKRHSRLFSGFEIGFNGGPLWIDGKRANEDVANLNYGFHAGCSHGVNRHFGVLGWTRFGRWTTKWGEARGEERYRVELAIGPELRLGPTGGWHCAVPIGLTVAQINEGAGRAVQDWYGPGRGLNVGLMAGYAFPGLHSAYFDLVIATHVMRMDHAARLTRSGALMKESYQYVNSEFMLAVGYLFRP